MLLLLLPLASCHWHILACHSSPISQPSFRNEVHMLIHTLKHRKHCSLYILLLLLRTKKNKKKLKTWTKLACRMLPRVKKRWNAVNCFGIVYFGR